MSSFNDLHPKTKIDVVKKEFVSVVKTIFEAPEMLKSYIKDKRLTTEESKQILKCINKFNSKECACCRRFDQSKLPSQIERDLEPLLDIAQTNVKQRNY